MTKLEMIENELHLENMEIKSKDKFISYMTAMRKRDEKKAGILFGQYMAELARLRGGKK